MNLFKKIRRFKASLKYNEAVRMTDNAHAEDKGRYYVMPTMDGQLAIVDRANFRTLKQKGYINRNASIADLERECFYHTSYRDGKGQLLEADRLAKREMFFEWSEALSKVKKKRL